MVAGVPVVWLSRPVMDVESECEWLPGVRVPPPWPYFMRRPLLRGASALLNKRVYRLAQNSGFVK
jgi:hypothetical protein